MSFQALSAASELFTFPRLEPLNLLGKRPIDPSPAPHKNLPCRLDQLRPHEAYFWGYKVSKEDRERLNQLDAMLGQQKVCFLWFPQASVVIASGGS